MMKKVLGLVVSIMVVVSACFITTEVYAETRGECGNDVLWSIDNGILTISGTGEMTSAPWRTEFLEEIVEVIIEDGVESICDEAFSSCKNLEKTIISDSITKVGIKVFYNCAKLKTVKLPKSLRKIPEYTFYSCTQLNEITYPENITEIGPYAFQYCKSLGQEYRIPDGVVDIGEAAFLSCQFEKLIVPNSVKNLNRECFIQCMKLKDIIFEEGCQVEKIDTNAFTFCSALTTFTIPKSVKEFGRAVFSYCSNLKEIKVESGNPNFVVQDGFLFDGDMKRIICSFLFAGESYKVPDGVETISTYAFDQLTTLKELIIPNSVKRIETVAINGCKNLERITIPFVGTQRGISGTYDSVFGAIFSSIGVTGSAGISNGVVHKYSEDMNKDCLMGYFVPSKLKEITITDEKVIPYGAFSNCSNIEKINLPDTVEEIKPYAFYNCSKISEINISKNVDIIGKFAFQGCNSLNSVNYFGTNSAWERIEIKNENSPLLSAVIRTSSENLKAESPEISITNIIGGKSVSITSSDINTKIYYTLDGSEPNITSPLFDRELMFKDETETVLKTIAVKSGYDISESSSETIRVARVDKPVASHENGILDAKEKVLLSSASESEIYYTLDGSDPLKYGVKYIEGVSISLPATLRAVSLKKGLANSEEAIYRYVSEYVVPIIEEVNVVNIRKNIATLQIKISNIDELGIYDVNFVYNEKNNLETNTETVKNKNYVIISDLKTDCEYEYYVKIVNGNKEVVSEINSFKTLNYDVPEEITLSKSNVKIGVGEKTKINASISPVTAVNKNIMWSSSDSQTVTVDEDGNLTGKKNGSAIITATAEDGGIVANCRVVVYTKYVVGEKDFSEINMATNTKVHAEHGLNISSDGGTNMMAMLYLARWDGVVEEGKDRYPSLTSSADYGYTLEYLYREVDADYHLQNAYFIPQRTSADDNDMIKEFVVEYGAVSTSFYVNSKYFGGENRENYYMPTGGNGSGHAVAIVGWEDDYPAENFTITPPGDGAFICKNSWGEHSHDDGYFYISYYDAGLGIGEESFVLPELETKENYDKIWQHDYMGPTNKIGYTGTTYAANVFPGHGESVKSDQILRAVSFYTVAQNMSYEIYVIEDYKDQTSLVLSEPVTRGVLSEMGYHTIELEDEIVIDEGNRFAVIVKFSMQNISKKANIFIESPVKYVERASARLDESYVSSDGFNWIDLAGKIDNANVCIKAFTDELSNFDVLFENGDNPITTQPTLLSLGEDIEMFSQQESEEQIFTGFMSAYTRFDSPEEPYTSYLDLPQKYDLRKLGYVSPVKDQGSYGTCWAFSAYASLESCLLKKASNVVVGDEDRFTETAISKDGKTITVDLFNIENGETVILALYVDERFIELQSALYDGESIIFTTTADYTTAKVMVWNSMEKLTPICEDQEIFMVQ